MSVLAESLQPESQCGYRTERGTVDMIFAVPQLREKCREQHQDLFLIFVDLTKAFDSVSRDGLWKILKRTGCLDKLVNMLRSFHDGMQARVIDGNQEFAPFEVKNGVKQACVLVLVLFGIIIAAMIKDAFKNCKLGVRVRHWHDGGLFNLRRLKARTKVSYVLIRELLYTDDCAVACLSEEDAERLVDCFARSAVRFGLTISIKTTGALLQPKLGTIPTVPAVKVGQNRLKAVDEFRYLGGTVSSNCSVDADITSRIAKASATFGRLSRRLWNTRDVHLSTKLAVYKAAVISVLLHNCETWTMYRRQIRQLDSFHMRCLRRIAGISWKVWVTNTEVLERCRTRGIEAHVMEARLGWAGHMTQMDETRIPRILLFGELEQGTRHVGRPLKRYKDQLKATLKRCQIQPDNFESLSSDRATWRALCSEAVDEFEHSMVEELKEKRRRRKERIAAPGSFPFDRFPRVCSSAIGLRSYLKAHERTAARTTADTA